MVKHGVYARRPFKLTPNLLRCFFSKVDIGKTIDECWLWTGATRNGYGCLKHNCKLLSAHRLAYVIRYRQIPERRIICHKCDVRLCCNPHHLYAGTPSQNRIDVTVRGRMPTMVLTPELVREIWKLRQQGLGKRRIAKKIGVNASTVGAVLIGKSWTHVST